MPQETNAYPSIIEAYELLTAMREIAELNRHRRREKRFSFRPLLANPNVDCRCGMVYIVLQRGKEKARGRSPKEAMFMLYVYLDGVQLMFGDGTGGDDDGSAS